MTHQPMTVTERGVTLRDFAIFQLKLVLDGTKDFVAFWASIFAIILDFIAGRGRRPRLFYSVVRASEKFDKWINLHSVVQEMDAERSEEGLLGARDAASETFIGEIERLVRGGEADRARAIDLLRTRSEKIRKKVLDPPRGPEGGGDTPDAGGDRPDAGRGGTDARE